MSNQEDFLYHWGVSGMRWGVRRYQYSNGTLTELGKKRYGDGNTTGTRQTAHVLNKVARESQIAKSRAEVQTKYANYYDWRSAGNARKSAKLEAKSMSKPSYSLSGKAQELKSRRKAKKSDRFSIKAEKRRIKAEEYDKLAKEGQQFIDNVIDVQLQQGKSVKSKNVLRFVGYDSDGYEKYTVGRRYRIKDDGKGNRTHKRRGLSDDYVYKQTTIILPF